MHTEAFGWALHCCHGDAGLAEEVLQNAYVKCLQGRLMAWLRSWFGDAQEPADAHPHPARQIELDDEAARLRRLLARLPARQAEVLHLVFYEHLTIAEAAVVMGVGVGSARQHYERGKRRLREWLEQEER